MTYRQKARSLLDELRAVDASNDEGRIDLLVVALVRASIEHCPVCQTGHGDERGLPAVQCAICRKEPEVIVCYDCARENHPRSWGS